ncbi:MAG TPA: hypothetical protein V6D14_01940 [Coleofasciculaceae cyanobacterium]|jgi:hypothetical protein
MVDTVDTNGAPIEDDWRARYARMSEQIRRTDEIQKRWRSMPPTTLVDAAKALCDRDAPPPTTEELLWLKENLIQHQQSVEKLIQLIEALLEHQNPDT